MDTHTVLSGPKLLHALRVSDFLQVTPLSKYIYVYYLQHVYFIRIDL